MILYIGKKHHVFFLNDVVRKINSTDDKIETLEVFTITEAIAPATEKPYQHIVVDVTSFANEADEIASGLLTIQKVANTNIIIIAQGVSPNSNLIVALYSAGFKNFVLQNLLADKKEECFKCMTGYYDINPIPFENEIMKMEIAEEEKPKEDISLDAIRQAQKQKIEIGIVGTVHRIGTTTQALQLVKYLTLKGYKACYIEANQSGWILSYMSTRTEDEYRYVEQIGLVSYKEMDLYVNAESISTIKKKDYDFFIFDYGCYQDDTFEKMSFMEKNIGIVVGGIKPAELESTDAVMEDTLSFPNIYYIFSFIDTETSDKTDILEFMENRADHTTFAQYAPNPFQYSSSHNISYDKIMELKDISSSDGNRAKKGIFQRKRLSRKERSR